MHDILLFEISNADRIRFQADWIVLRVQGPVRLENPTQPYLEDGKLFGVQLDLKGFVQGLVYQAIWDISPEQPGYCQMIIKSVWLIVINTVLRRMKNDDRSRVARKG